MLGEPVARERRSVGSGRWRGRWARRGWSGTPRSHDASRSLKEKLRTCHDSLQILIAFTRRYLRLPVVGKAPTLPSPAGGGGTSAEQRQEGGFVEDVYFEALRLLKLRPRIGANDEVVRLLRYVGADSATQQLDPLLGLATGQRAERAG